MKPLFAGVALASLVAAGPVGWAQQPASPAIVAQPAPASQAPAPVATGRKDAAAEPAGNAQRDRIVSCNATASARALSGDARKSFMSPCLSGKSTPTTMMKVCNAQASQDKLGADARKSYLGTCLKTSS